MAVKYECPKCGRRFTEWGAEKNGLKCPNDEWSTHQGEEIELVIVGSQEERSARKPSLKRNAKRARSLKPVPTESDTGTSNAVKQLGEDSPEMEAITERGADDAIDHEEDLLDGDDVGDSALDAEALVGDTDDD